MAMIYILQSVLSASDQKLCITQRTESNSALVHCAKFTQGSHKKNGGPDSHPRINARGPSFAARISTRRSFQLHLSFDRLKQGNSDFGTEDEVVLLTEQVRGLTSALADARMRLILSGADHMQLRNFKSMEDELKQADLLESELRSEGARLKHSVQQLEGDIALLTAELGAARTASDHLQKALDARTEAVRLLMDELSRAREDEKGAHSYLESLEEEFADVKAELLAMKVQRKTENQKLTFLVEENAELKAKCAAFDQLLSTQQSGSECLQALERVQRLVASGDSKPEAVLEELGGLQSAIAALTVRHLNEMERLKWRQSQ